MLSSSLSYIIIRSLPECMLMLIASYILLNLDLKLEEVIKKSIWYAAVVLVIRTLPISFGIHTIFSMFVLGTILYKFKNQNIINTILTIAKIFVCLGASEGIYMAIVTGVFKIPVEVLTDNTNILSAILSLPSLIVFIGLVFLFKQVENRIANNRQTN